MKSKLLSKRLLCIGPAICLVVLLSILCCHWAVVSNADGRTFDDVDSIPYNMVGLLLGTSPITPGGAHNFYFDNRIKAADELYKAGKVDFIIASGGDYTKVQKNGCDEPKAILDSLAARGIPTDRIILDYEGTRTLNSIAKVKEIYCLDSITLISQKYHNERAIYIADQYGLHAVGYNAAPSPIRRNRIKNILREYLARVKMFIDNFVGSEPYFEKKDHIIHNNLDNHTSLLELFYGMEKNSTGEYEDAVLDTIPGLVHKEFSSIWCHHPDCARFEISLGIYLDNDYPSAPVRESILKKLNSVIHEGFSYDADDMQMALLKNGVTSIHSSKSFLNEWNNLFNHVSQLNGYGSLYAHYPMIIGSRGCAICHKVYEDSVWATYLIGMSVDYHSSCGCPSSSDYYSINKESGEILTIAELVIRNQHSDISTKIQREYRRLARLKGFTPLDYSDNKLLRLADGVAIINEGILFYYQPYNIGCGAEGQYNIIIDL